MIIRGTLLVLLVALGAACGSAEGALDSTADPVPATSVAADATLSEKGTTTSPAREEPVESTEVAVEVVDFVASLGALLVGTGYEEALDSDAEVFVATGLLFCEQLTDGAMPDALLTDYVEALTDGAIDDADDGSLTLAGATLGSAVGHLCPEHIDVVEEAL